MPCDTVKRSDEQLRRTLERLSASLADGTVKVVIGPQGSVAFRNWTDNDGMADACAYRALLASNSPELRSAIMRAEVMSGRKVNEQIIAAGVHSHDGGRTWGSH